ncbi:MAG: OmpA family protein [Gammaproteobacteria bacterium SHHR-1]|uniref:OmpA family protein n=1 Tax=Magnetovirga frankeli TaxID=947516 RepID=UPI001292D0E1|nr:OmpA family protein [gamma proteobacterium SS-5]
MKISLKLLGIGLLVLLLAGCGSWSKKTGAAADGAAAANGAQTSGVDGGGLGGSGYGSGVGSGDPLSQRIIYFDYDSAEIKAEYRSVIAAHAQSVRGSGKSLVLEGHSDERGSREYNIALGERRANTVKRLMVAGGASPSQIRTISYGEERPAVQSSDGQSMAQNRRVEIVYR